MAFVCKECDSEDVEVQSWVNPNTGMEGENNGIPSNTTWCKTCVESDLGIEWKDNPLPKGEQEQ